MNTRQIADRLVELCRQGQFETAQTELFAADADSIEPPGAQMPNVKGLAAIQEKGRQFMAGIEAFHSTTVSDALVAADHFSLAMALDVTMKGAGRVQIEEICVYRVAGGKIASEQFFYSGD